MTMLDERNLEHSDLERRVTNRTRSLFAEDLVHQWDDIRDTVKGRSFLIIGGAGSIGFRTIRTILPFGPAVVHVVDHNENGLAELVRQLRSGFNAFDLSGLLTLPFDYGGAPFSAWLSSRAGSYDYILNFAALKHVRSEKDPYSILAMLDNNVSKLRRLQNLMAHDDRLRRLFCVSTDKAANPSSMMGATKRLMEHTLFQPPVNTLQGVKTSSARFANVAFSNGSLLQSWQLRLAAGQPLACPKDCRRYFLSLRESGHLCTIAALLGPHQHLLIPDLDPENHLILLTDLVRDFLSHEGYDTIFFDDETEAKAFLTASKPEKSWPVLLTPLDTSGEKPYEEFHGANETVLKTRFEKLKSVPYLPPQSADAFEVFETWLRNTISDELAADGAKHGNDLSIDYLREMVATVEHAFRHTHVQSSKSLDQRM